MAKRDNKKILEEKLQQLKELLITIEVYGNNPITREQKSREEDERSRMEFRLNELVIESKIAEADIKINSFKEIIKIIKENQ